MLSKLISVFLKSQERPWCECGNTGTRSQVRLGPVKLQEGPQGWRTRGSVSSPIGRVEVGVPGYGRVDPQLARLPSPGSRKPGPAPQTCYWKSEGWAAPPVPTSSSPAPPPAARAFMGTEAWTVSLKSFALCPLLTPPAPGGTLAGCASREMLQRDEGKPNWEGIQGPPLPHRFSISIWFTTSGSRFRDSPIVIWPGLWRYSEKESQAHARGTLPQAFAGEH